MALKSIKALALASLAAGPAAAAYDCSTSKAGCTPLDDYVNAPDSTYKWEDLNITLDGPGWTARGLARSQGSREGRMIWHVPLGTSPQ